MKFKVVAEWLVSRTYEIEADTLMDAIELVEGNEKGCAPTTGGEYVDDTFEVNEQMTQELNKE